MAATSADQDHHLKDPMTSGTHETSPTPQGHGRAQTAQERPQRQAGAWVETLRRSDVSRLWTELQRLVVNHPLVRASYSAGLLVEEGDRGSAYLDLTQELFVTLLSKSRFQHYLDTEMTDSEIECEVSQIELTNLLTAELRKRHPESYRLARRISTIIQSSANFRRFDPAGSNGASHRRLATQLYGLSVWPVGKSTREMNELERRARLIPVRRRDTRMVGCAGDTQVIIGNSDLEDLIVSVLEACDSPVDVRTLRGLVMSRLPVMDIYLVPLVREGGGDESRAFEPVDGRENPEQGLLRRETESGHHVQVERLLEGLSANVRGKARQYERMVAVLWYSYLSPKRYTQLEVAAMLGVSDSLVSEYRRRIERELRALSLADIAEARDFEVLLREHVSRLMGGSPAAGSNPSQTTSEREADICDPVR
jgi:hypothetical protein